MATSDRHSNSPMLTRVKKHQKGHRGLPLPRKGRIRIVLLLFVVGGAILFYRAKSETPSTETKEHASIAETTEKNTTPPSNTASKESARGKKKRSDSKQRRENKSLTIGDISALLSSQSLNLKASCDTLSWKREDLALHTSLDPYLQKAGKKLLRRYHPKYGAIACMDPVSGRVLSLVSWSKEGEPYLGKNLWGKTLFPAASIMKTVTAAGAIEKGHLSRRSKMKHYGKNHTLYLYQLKKELPRHRLVPLEDAFAYSINPIFGRIGIYVLGYDGLRSYADRFGFSQPIPFELNTEPAEITITDSTFYLAELASGFNQKTRISPLFGALMASSISEGGLIPVPTLVDSAVNIETGEKRYQSSPGLWKIAVKQETAGTVKRMMMSVVRYGTARKSFKNFKSTAQLQEFECGGKTGSVDKDGIGRVDWFIGFARHPHDEDKRIAAAVVTVHGPFWTVHSSYIASELFRNYLRRKQRLEETQKTETMVAEKPHTSTRSSN